MYPETVKLFLMRIICEASLYDIRWELIVIHWVIYHIISPFIGKMIYYFYQMSIDLHRASTAVIVLLVNKHMIQAYLLLEAYIHHHVNSSQ
jgi:hypothetical protein